MKAFLATYEETAPPKPNEATPRPHLTVGAASLRAAAVKATQCENKEGRGELIRLELTDQVIL